MASDNPVASAGVLVVDDRHSRGEFLCEQFAGSGFRQCRWSPSTDTGCRSRPPLKPARPFASCSCARDLSAADPFALGTAIRSRGVAADVGADYPLGNRIAGSRIASRRIRRTIDRSGAAIAIGADHRRGAGRRSRPAETSTESQPPTRPTAVDAAPPALTGRILVAEDNEINQIVVAEMLTRAGYTCEIAGNGRQAVEMIARGFLRPGPDGLPDARNGWLRSHSGDPPGRTIVGRRAGVCRSSP